MAQRRLPLNCKLKTRVAFLCLLLIFISMTLLYRAVTSEDGHETRSQKYFPTLEKKRPVRFQSKHFSNFDINQPLQRHVDNLRHGQQVHLGPVRDRDLLSADSKEALSNFLSKLYPVNWATAPETDDLALELKYLLLDYGFESRMSCKDIDGLHLGHSITFTRSKFIEYGYVESIDNDYNRNFYDSYNYGQNFNLRRGQRRESDMAIKSPSNDLETKIECMKQIYDSELCSTMGNYRFLREVLLMVTLHHPSIPILKGYCLRGKSVSSNLQEKGLILVTEVGSPLSQSLVYASTWRQRLSIALQISELLQYLDNSPVGSLRLSKIQMKDFVLIGGTMAKLVDLDDLLLGERRCSSSSGCQLNERKKGVECFVGVCEGFNSLSNLDLVSKQVLLPLLHNPPVEQGEVLYEKIQQLDTNIAEVVSELHAILSQTPLDPPPKLVRPPALNEARGWKEHLDSGNRQEVQGNSVEMMNIQNKRAPMILDSSEDDVMSHFIRRDQKNFPGIFDYPCPGSRVSWGCVFTVNSLNRAGSLCYSDPTCKSFVTFSTRPEDETLMTILLKNATDSEPQTSSGTTLFIKKSLPSLTNDAPVEEHDEDELDEEDEDDELEDPDQIAAHDCVERTIQTYESARYSREKRLMTHLGLKGVREQSWRRSAALQQNFGNFSRIVKAGGGGGKFQVHLERQKDNDMPAIASKALFLAEDGPKNYHLAYALVYHLDRLLGFYHTPPCVGKKLTANELESFHQSANWEGAFQPLIESDGSLNGILMTSVPKVMKVNKVSLLPLPALTTEVERFERPDKLQLEYMILSWMAGMEITNGDHLGYKGHLIHFNADQAFRNTSVNLSGYLHHCQFPNVAYKALLCFRCKEDPVGTTICHLGEEAAMRLRSMFEDDVELNFHQRTETKLVESINGVASHIMFKVDQCIKSFGRETVLY